MGFRIDKLDLVYEAVSLSKYGLTERQVRSELYEAKNCYFTSIFSAEDCLELLRLYNHLEVENERYKLKKTK
jgi:hypothetical protein